MSRSSPTTSGKAPRATLQNPSLAAPARRCVQCDGITRVQNGIRARKDGGERSAFLVETVPPPVQSSLRSNRSAHLCSMTMCVRRQGDRLNHSGFASLRAASAFLNSSVSASSSSVPACDVVGVSAQRRDVEGGEDTPQAPPALRQPLLAASPSPVSSAGSPPAPFAVLDRTKRQGVSRSLYCTPAELARRTCCRTSYSSSPAASIASARFLSSTASSLYDWSSLTILSHTQGQARRVARG